MGEEGLGGVEGGQDVLYERKKIYLIKKISGADGMAQWIKVPSTKTNDLSWVLRPKRQRGKQVLTSSSLTLHLLSFPCRLTHQSGIIYAKNKTGFPSDYHLRR